MSNAPAPAQAVTGHADHIPIVWVEPVERLPGSPLALWLPYFTSAKELVVPFLRELAAAGFVAASFDPWQHGERGSESSSELGARVFSAFRRHMWPIIAQTTLDAVRVVDWMAEHLETGPHVVAGGLSMGGDVAVALAGVEPRVGRVAAVVSTPDWTRPGMRLDGREVAQGEPDGYARWLYERLDPLTNLDAYARGPAIAFECAAEDDHVPPDGALRFQGALRERHPAAAERVRVTLHPGLDHRAGAEAPDVHRRCYDWLVQESPAG